MRPLLAPEVIRDAKRSAGFLHPLLRQPFDFYDPLGQGNEAERISPLFSQPLMELCLRIPTYVLTEGGWDRAVARRAFYARSAARGP